MMDDLTYLLVRGLEFASRHGKSKCVSCHSKLPVKEMINVERMKKDVDFQYVNRKWVIYHLLLKDKVDRRENTNIVWLCSNCYQ